MAAAGDMKDLCDEATCPICLDYFTNPVTIAECGHNFCRACLTECWAEAEEVVAASCPQCRGAVQQRTFIPNRQLANFVEIAKKLSLRGQGGVGEAAEGICEQHQEPLKLFCKDHEAPICVVCDRSKEHESHKVIPQEEAFLVYKDQICSRLKILRAERDKTLKYKAEAEKESQDLLNQTEEQRQKTMAEFEQIRQFLEEQEKIILAQIDGLEKEIVRRRDEHMAGLCRELSSLENVIQEMEKKCQQPASEFLQDIRRTLQRSKKKEALETSVAFPPELTSRIKVFRDVEALRESVMKQFQAANVTLDPDTAHPELILSEDCKSVRWGDQRQALPDNPQRFDFWRFVLGCEGFTTGTHFWNVDVGNEDRWAVGVARKSVRRKGWFDFSSKEGIWAVGKSGGQYKVFTVFDHIPLFLSQEIKRIRVTLNCAEGQVGFSDADTGVHLYTFAGASFCGETLLPLFHVFWKAQLRLSP